ncbi:hypothetical protein BCV69DRAFT_314841 [Microstroma glucosiphilum]|uniref:CUE domain-containing protein n=1 Tax=Pseudomicrostroma glucosiphilum TaxID=1684307 RepID=A0A316TYM5_9BASI|nr:hypothetical protein BCV69DRAFT_314841 [Pseudomicrostroma glucosiphilum]PWN18322.1 hypothetical protein BCV69DRAFT_314841 [Pseudomicrostroma glucosiphilum]
MTVSSPTPLLTPAVAKLLGSLSTIAASQLSILILQQPQLPRLLSRALQTLSLAVLSRDWPVEESSKATDSIIRLLENAANSEDPSLAKRLLPTKDATINLCILGNDSYSQRIHNLLPHFIDATISEELLSAAAESCRGSSSDRPSQLSRAVRIADALLRHLPTPVKQQSHSRTPQIGSDQVAAQIKADDIAAAIASKYAELGSSSSADVLSCKVHLLDAASSLLQRYLASGQTNRLATCAVSLTSAAQGPSTSSSDSAQALISLPLLVDLLLARTELASSLRTALSSPASTPAEDQTRQTALAGLQAAQEDTAAAASRANQAGDKTDLGSLGGGWETLLQSLQQERLQERETESSARRRAQSKGKDKVTNIDQPAEVSPSLLGMVEAILPHLAADESRLKTLLSKPKYSGKSDEEVIQMLLDEDTEDGVHSEAAAAPQSAPHPISASASPPPTAPPSKPRRANIFSDQPLDSTRLRWGGNGDSTDQVAPIQPISGSLKSQILARVSAQTAEEEAALRGEEWNPFSTNTTQEVGFEEELDEAEEEDERLNRRRGIAQIGGESGNAREWRRRLEDLSDEEEEEDDDEEQSAAKTLSPSAAAGGAAAERMAERVLILAYSQHGPALFAREASSRKSASRRDLKKELEAKTGKAWDDSLVESWGTMFERNPRKDTLLSSAASHDLLSGGNPNLAPPPTQQRPEGGRDASQRGFGPDRGRGGRMPRGGDRGGSGGGRGGGRGGGAGGGGGEGGGSNRGRGGHSGNDRGAKNKERRGNAARTRGADRKARMMGGPGAGI